LKEREREREERRGEEGVREREHRRATAEPMRWKGVHELWQNCPSTFCGFVNVCWDCKG